MDISFYTVDDLRKGNDRNGVCGWKQSRFLDRKDALTHYRAIPGTCVKTLGFSDGEHDHDLIRCVPLFPGDKEGTDILVIEFASAFCGSLKERLCGLARDWAMMLDVRFILSNGWLIPKPAALSKDLDGMYVWEKVPGDFSSAISQIYVAGEGWRSPAELKSLEKPRDDHHYPLLSQCMVWLVSERGKKLGKEVTPYEYLSLVMRSREKDHSDK